MESVSCDSGSSPAEWAAAALDDTRAIITSLLSMNAKLAIAVWQPRADPAKRFTSRLKASNHAFRDLCDVAHFLDDRTESVLVTQPVVANQETEAVLRASLLRIAEMCDAIHTGEALHARSYALHLSRLGRQKIVCLDIIAVQKNARLAEFISTERLMPDAFVLPHDLLEPFAFETIIHRNSHHAIAAATTAREGMFSQWVFSRHGAKTSKWTMQVNSSKKRRIFYDGKWACVQCSARETTQRRYDPRLLPWLCPACFCDLSDVRRRGPDGPLTLCNRCGLRFLKSEQGLEATSAAPTPTVFSIDSLPHPMS